MQEGLVIENAEGKELTVTSLTNDSVTLDRNHPLARKTADLYVEVVAVRDATLKK